MYKELCPHLYNGPNNTRTCCDIQQLSYFDRDLTVPKQLMSRCPACFTNFVAFLCDLTCGPTQSDFLVINSFRPTPSISSARNKEIDDLNTSYETESSEDANKRKKRNVKPNEQKYDVTEVTYYMTNNFTSGLFNSCK